MGEHIDGAIYSKEDFDGFKSHLRQETEHLIAAVKEGGFTTEQRSLGLEIETWVVDNHDVPRPDNRRILELLDNPMIVPELSQFNCEINTPPQVIQPGCLSTIHTNLKNLWDSIHERLATIERKFVMIGSLPTLDHQALCLSTMSDEDRYRGLNHEIMRLNQGRQSLLKLTGRDQLDIGHDDVMLEAAATSLQIHLQLEPELLPRLYNASMVASPFMAAATANTPFVCGKSLWSESRIPVFEQALNLPGFHNSDNDYIGRVTFGSGYIHSTLLECFQENLQDFPVLLPINKDGAAVDELYHLKLHNGNIWRWNRPIVGQGVNGAPTLRMEHRVPASGPSLVDTVANIALYCGLAYHFATLRQPVEAKLPFSRCRQNFYAAARYGLDAEICWNGVSSVSLYKVLWEELLPRAREALQDMGFAEQEICFYFDEVLAERLRLGRTGSNWQRQAAERFGLDQMLKAYIRNQHRDTPVFEWSL